MPTAWESFPVEFKGGLISNMNALEQGLKYPGSATFLQNYEPSKEGGYRKITGFAKFSADAISGSGDILGVKVVSGSRVIAVRRNGSSVSQYWTSTGTSWSSLGSAASLGNRTRGALFQFGADKKIMFVDGVNSPARYNVTSNTLDFPSLPADTTGASFIEVYKNAIFLAKGPNLVFSAPFTETDFTPASGGGIINVGDDITGLIVFRDELFIFSRNKINRLIGNTSTDFQVVPVTQDLGCIQPDTIQEVGGDIMFMGPDGLRLLSATDRNGDFGLEIASANITKEATTFLNSASQFCSYVVRGKAQYRILAYNDTTAASSSRGLLTTKFSDQGASRLEWATIVGIKMSCVDGMYVDSPVNELIVFGNNDGYIYEFDNSATFNGSNISAVFETPYIIVNDPQTRKTLYKMSMFVIVEGNLELNANIKYDFYRSANYNSGVAAPQMTLGNDAASGAIYGTAVFGTSSYGSQSDGVFDVNLVGSGKVFALRLEDNTSNASHKLDSVVFELRQHDRQ